MTAGENIARLRKQRKWTQAKLAKVVGLSTGYIAAIEEGKVRPKLKTLAIIAESLGTDVDGLIKE